MNWCKFLKSTWGASVYVLAATLVLAIILKLLKHNKRRQIITPMRAFFVGVFLSAVVYFIPLHMADGMNKFTAVLNAIQHAFRIFGLDGDFVEVIFKREYPGGIKTLYVAYGAVLYVVAPLFTFGFLLTFFKNFFASERSLKSLATALILYHTHLHLSTLF